MVTLQGIPTSSELNFGHCSFRFFPTAVANESRHSNEFTIGQFREKWLNCRRKKSKFFFDDDMRRRRRTCTSDAGNNNHNRNTATTRATHSEIASFSCVTWISLDLSRVGKQYVNCEVIINHYYYYCSWFYFHCSLFRSLFSINLNSMCERVHIR